MINYFSSQANKDQYGRVMRKLRVQLTDACNFRCLYCMPDNVYFTPTKEILSAEETIAICRNLHELGIEEIRVSGGEPLLRRDFDEIILGLSELNLRKLGLTTNAYNLNEKLPFLQTTNCHYINISLDSLNEANFKRITGSSHFSNVILAIKNAKQMGFSVKVNVVALRGMNDHEIFDFIQFSADEGVEVRFLELMKIGLNEAKHEALFIKAQDIITDLKKKMALEPVLVSEDSTSFNYRTSTGAQIGFIASESQPFCNFCSRLRLTAKGALRACLMSTDEMNLRHLEKAQYPQLLRSVMQMKPISRLYSVDQSMYQIGG